jgi:exo-beta-1,3-glucanase (GH17 family)
MSSVFSSITTRLLLFVLVALTLSACGGGGSGTVASTRDAIRPLSPEFSTRKAVAYSPFRTALSVDDLPGEVIPEANIKQDLDLLVAAGFGLIRLFDSSDKVAGQTLSVIRKHNLNIKVMLGAYVQSGDETFNQAELKRTIALAQKYSDIVLAVSVGNETMVYWSFNRISPEVMAGYLATVRSQIAQPVTTDDNWDFYSKAPRVILDTIDFASMHTYPELDTVFNPTLWDWKQLGVEAVPGPDTVNKRATAMMDAAIASAQNEYNAVRAHLDSKYLSSMPIVIGETGWNAVDVGSLKYRAHPVNQKMYYDRLLTWAAAGRTGPGPKAIFYFEAFDEAWKQSDDKWGLFDKERRARYVIQDLNPPSSTWVYAPGNFKPSDAVYFIPPKVNDPITVSKYVLYSDTPPNPTEVRPPEAGALTWNAWDGSTAVGRFVSTSSAPDDSPNSFEVTPAPKVWGWGMFYGSTQDSSANLSQYADTGHLNFWVKTTYPGKIELGLFLGDADGGTVDAYLTVAEGDYGYCQNGTWCKVSIPLKDITKGTKGELSMVIHRFVIADRFEKTGKPLGTTGLPPIMIDRIYFSKN